MRFSRAAFLGRYTPSRRALSKQIAQLFLLSSLACAIVHGQTNQELEGEVVRVRTDLVTVPVSVTDARGQRVAGLSQSDFKIFDAGRAVNINYFAASVSRVALIFAADTSGSTHETISRQQDAALALYTRFGAESRVGLITFADRPVLVLPLTDQVGQARAAFNFSSQSNRRTAVFDAALSAVRAFNNNGRSHLAERRIVVLLSDGLDTASQTRAAVVVEEARRNNISFYVVHLPLYTPDQGRLVIRKPAKGFRELAAQTGGRYFLLGDMKDALNPRARPDLSPIFEAIAADLHTQYQIGYYLDEATRGTGEHRIEVKLISPVHRKLRVQNLLEGYKLQ
ncbi:MAG: VWA domain-containing protein [Pyrinomonadaceae bacterium]|nr:VWA domain-containing protein [Pyrinomonadaceae bacterium]